MRVDPEQVLVQERVTALGGIEHPDAEEPLHEDKDHRDPDHRGGQDLDPRGGVDPPDGKRQPEERHPGRALQVHRRHDVEPGQDGGHAQDEDAEDRQGTFTVVRRL